MQWPSMKANTGARASLAASPRPSPHVISRSGITYRVAALDDTDSCGASFVLRSTTMTSIESTIVCAYSESSASCACSRESPITRSAARSGLDCMSHVTAGDDWPFSHAKPAAELCAGDSSGAVLSNETERGNRIPFLGRSDDAADSHPVSAKRFGQLFGRDEHFPDVRVGWSKASPLPFLGDFYATKLAGKRAIDRVEEYDALSSQDSSDFADHGIPIDHVLEDVA